MVVSTLSADPQRELLALINESAPDPTDWFARLRALRTEREIPAFAEIVRLVLNLGVSEDVAEAIVGEILEHRHRVHRALGRDPGFAVAALDFATHLRYLLRDPVSLDRDALDPILSDGTHHEPGKVRSAGSFAAALDDELRRSRRFGGPFAIAVVRLDRFATLVTHAGIARALTVLQDVAHGVAAAVRDTDVVARLDTDRSAVLFPGTDRLGAFVAAERLRMSIRSQTREQPVTVSTGIAEYPADALDAPRLLRRASRALRTAVSSGGDRVAQHDAERRRAVRFPARRSTVASVTSGDGVRTARGVDLARHGALLEFDGPIAVGQEIRIQLERHRPTGRAERWEAPARIVRSFEWGHEPRTHRAGVEFERSLTHSELAWFAIRHEVDESSLGGRS